MSAWLRRIFTQLRRVAARGPVRRLDDLTAERSRPAASSTGAAGGGRRRARGGDDDRPAATRRGPDGRIIRRAGSADADSGGSATSGGSAAWPQAAGHGGESDSVAADPGDRPVQLGRRRPARCGCAPGDPAVAGTRRARLTTIGPSPSSDVRLQAWPAPVAAGPEDAPHLASESLAVDLDRVVGGGRALVACAARPARKSTCRCRRPHADRRRQLEAQAVGVGMGRQVGRARRPDVGDQVDTAPGGRRRSPMAGAPIRPVGRAAPASSTGRRGGVARPGRSR